jgi:hypothetical protein
MLMVLSIFLFSINIRNKGYYGSDRKVMLMRSKAYTNVTTMRNQIQKTFLILKGLESCCKSFMTSNGLSVDFGPTII